MLRRVHVVVIATIVCLFSGAVGTVASAKSPTPPPATPTTSDLVARARAAIAKGAGRSQISPNISTPVSVTLNDPSGDGANTNDPRGDIVSAGAGEDRAGLVFRATMATPSNPANDANWAAETALAFFVDTNFDGHFDAVVFAEEVGGHLETVLVGYVSEDSCIGSGSFDGTNIVIAFPHCNIGAFRWRVEMEYDTTPGNAADVPQIDHAPDSGFSAPTPTHRTGYILETIFGLALSFGETPQVAESDFTFVPDSMSATNDGLSVWATDAEGHVHAYGLGRYKGGSPTLQPGEEVVAIVAMPASQGYRLFTTQGRVFNFGTAHMFGDLATKALNMPIVGAAVTPSGNGYYLVGRDGGVFTFGDAHFRGSTGGMRLNEPVVGIAVTADNSGYWLAAGYGGVFAFHAPFRGSMGGTPLVAPVVGIARYGNGYVMAGGDAGVFNFSNAPFRGSGFNLSGIPLPFDTVGIGGFFGETTVTSIIAVDV